MQFRIHPIFLAIGYCMTILAYIVAGVRVSDMTYKVPLEWFVFGAALFPIVMVAIGFMSSMSFDLLFWATDELGITFYPAPPPGGEADERRDP